MKNILNALLLIFINLYLVGCINLSNNTSNEPLALECNLNTSTISSLPPQQFLSSNLDAPTIILIHEKNMSPTDSHMQTLATSYNYDGYNVIMPYMSWSTTQWNGTLCENISYINYLVAIEKAQAREVILAGYGFGATISLIYAALPNVMMVDDINVIAPNHFIHESGVAADANEESVLLAKEMTENNQSQVETLFQTYTNSVVQNITTTPEIYLSFHDITQFPDIKSTIPLVRIPLLWIAGESDPLTSFAITQGFIDLIPLYENSSYKEVVGNHFTLVNQVSDEFNAWYTGSL